MTPSEVRVYRMTLQYAGTRFLGWQTQPGGGTVQDTVEGCLSRILDHPIRVHGAGRTDRGVHARGQVASFQTPNPLPPSRLFRGLNALLPPEIVVTAWGEAAPGFHARHSARSREYSYQIWRAEWCSPFDYPFVYHLYRPLDLGEMERAAAKIEGKHDFTSFCAAESVGERMEREVLLSRWETERELLRYRVAANGFVHHMVRTLVGTLLDVGLGRRTPEGIPAVLKARDRRAAGPTLPAKGLFLERVGFGEDDMPGPQAVGGGGSRA